MSALWSGNRDRDRGDDRADGRTAPRERILREMAVADLDEVMIIEVAAYPFPWTRGNFIDSLAAGYAARVLRDAASGELIGYFVAMAGVDEMHLLNITVAPAEEGRGHARFMFDALIALSAAQGARELWLEVRESNARARAAYLHFGFAQVGTRKGYYPASFGRREHAVVMSLKIAAPAVEANDALE
ncbi:ribosomal protein S18-alanine N-acetyltransferase [soil metagenome]